MATSTLPVAAKMRAPENQRNGEQLPEKPADGSAPVIETVMALEFIRWLKILWKMWTEKKPYDADRHLRDQIKHGSWVISLISQPVAQPN